MLHMTEEGIDQLRRSLACNEREKAMQRLDDVQQQMTQFHALLDRVEELEASKEELAKSLIASRLELADAKSQNDHQKLALMRCEMDLKMAKAENARLRKDSASHEDKSRPGHSRSQSSRGERLTQSLRCGTKKPSSIMTFLDRSLRSECEEDDRRHCSSMTAMGMSRQGCGRLTEEKTTDLADQLRLDLLDIDDGGVDWGDSPASHNATWPIVSDTRRTPPALWTLSSEMRSDELTARDFAR